MNVRAPWLALVALCFLALVTFGGCGRSSLESDLLFDFEDAGDGAATCGPSTCPGCCAGGVCFAGRTQAQCGTGGTACAACPSNGHCDADAGSCVPNNVPPTCNCPGGCCDAKGACHPGRDGSSCGRDGGACADCTSAGKVCDPMAGVCEMGGQCGPCKGCCSGPVCVTGTGDKACGSGGGICDDCTVGSLTCETSASGASSCVVGCNANNCAGCCSPKGCVSGTDPKACGSGGQACAACPTGTEQCVPFNSTVGGGVCLSTACDPLECSGCCDPNGVCQLGTNGTSCGAQGLACVQCKSGQACVNGTCVTPAQCGPTNCDGCCAGNTCLGGGQNGACGLGGQACDDCGSTATCVNNACKTNGPCNPTTCPTGCCNGNDCVSGELDSACGAAGMACTVCTQSSAHCSAGSCTPGAACNLLNCADGCCDSNGACVPGKTAAKCGAGGFACTACGANSTCVNGYCELTCGPATCSGCCVSGVCATGTQDGACGTGGGACLNCSSMGQACQGAACVTKVCDATSCPLGCCDAQKNCQDGFLDGECGSGGAACVNCSAQGRACGVNQTPRGCAATSTCPSAYGGCPGGTTTKPLPIQNGACTVQDLAQAQSGCVGGPDSAGCQAFLQTLTSNGAAKCEACLAPLVRPYDQAVLLCAAPFTTASCNQATGCYADCETASCSQCAAADVASCETTARTTTCLTYTQGLTCLQSALGGTGAFCNPGAYTGYGAWLAAVGAHYCQ